MYLYMKAQKFIYLIIFCLATMICQAQFPSPRSFKMSYHYIHLDESGICCGKTIMGPAYCTEFQWEAPDLSETEAQLTGYNIYYYPTQGMNYDGIEIPISEGEVIFQTTDTYAQIGVGIIGFVWVTAVYSDPEGESDPSNIQFNDALPVAVKEVGKHPFFLTYNKQKNGIEIKGIENIISFRIFCLDGTPIASVATSDLHFIATNGIEKGIYIIKIMTKDTKIITEKWIKY